MDISFDTSVIERKESQEKNQSAVSSPEVEISLEQFSTCQLTSKTCASPNVLPDSMTSTQETTYRIDVTQLPKKPYTNLRINTPTTTSNIDSDSPEDLSCSASSRSQTQVPNCPISGSLGPQLMVSRKISVSNGLNDNTSRTTYQDRRRPSKTANRLRVSSDAHTEERKKAKRKMPAGSTAFSMVQLLKNAEGDPSTPNVNTTNSVVSIPVSYGTTTISLCRSTATTVGTYSSHSSRSMGGEPVSPFYLSSIPLTNNQYSPINFSTYNGDGDVSVSQMEDYSNKIGPACNVEAVLDNATPLIGDSLTEPKMPAICSGDINWNLSSLGRIVGRPPVVRALSTTDDSQHSCSSTCTALMTSPTLKSPNEEDIHGTIAPNRSQIELPEVPTSIPKKFAEWFSENRSKEYLQNVRRWQIQSTANISYPTSPNSDKIVCVTRGPYTYQLKKSMLDLVPRAKMFVNNESGAYLLCYANGATTHHQIPLDPRRPKEPIFFEGNLLADVQLYVEEYKKVQCYAPKDFVHYYLYVTGYQITNHNHPVTFLTFLEMHNGNQLEGLLGKYMLNLQKMSLSEFSADEWMMR